MLKGTTESYCDEPEFIPEAELELWTNYKDMCVLLERQKFCPASLDCEI